MRTLSKIENKVMQESGKAISTLDVIGILNCKKNQANLILHRMNKKGWIKRIGKGLYVKQEVIPYELLDILSDRYYVSFLTALNLHHLTTQVPTAILVVSSDTRKELVYKDTKIKFIKVVQKKFFGWREKTVEGIKVKVATPEKTLLDSLDKPRYSGGIKHVISCFKDFNSDLIAGYALRIGNRALIRRLGAILDHKGKLPSAKLERKLLKKAQERSYYTPLKKKEGEKIRKWRVIWNVD